MNNGARIDKGLRLKTCCSSFEDYLEQSSQNLIKNAIVSLPGFHQYRRRANTTKIQRTPLNAQSKNSQKIQQQTEIKQHGSGVKTGFFDILRVKIHSNQRYNKNVTETAVVNRKKYRSYLKVQVQRQFNGKQSSTGQEKIINRFKKFEDSESKKIINSKLQEILNKFSKSQQQSNKSKDYQQKIMFHKKAPNYKKSNNRVLASKTMADFQETPNKNQFYTLAGWDIQQSSQM